MKTSDEIKKGLKQCSMPGVHCSCCPYSRDGRNIDECITNLFADTLTYINRLEFDNERNSSENYVLELKNTKTGEKLRMEF